MNRSIDFLVDGCCGALLAALMALMMLWWVYQISWIFVAIAAVLGFLFGGFCGRQALEWFRENFFWWV